MPGNSYHVILLRVPEKEKTPLRATLYDHDCLGLEIDFSETDPSFTKLKAYFKGELLLQDFIFSLQEKFPNLSIIDNYLIGLSSNSKDSFPSFDPFPITDQIWITPPFTTPLSRQEKTWIELEPGSSFGSGKHETTQMMAEILPRFSDCESLLDVGTGTGILAILANKLGIPKIETVEIDEKAQENASFNFALNQAGAIPVYTKIEEAPFCYDVVIANLLTPTLLYLKESLISKMKQNGWLLLSGITENEKNEIVESYSSLSLVESFYLNEWCALLYCLNEDYNRGRGK